MSRLLWTLPDGEQTARWTSDQAGASGIVQADPVSLTAAQIRASTVTPVVLVPGVANKYHVIMATFMVYTYVAPVYTQVGSPRVRYASDAGGRQNFTIDLTVAASQASLGGSDAGEAMVANDDIVYVGGGSAPASGNGTAVIYVWYSII